MIRPFTCVCMLMFVGSGLYLYQAKHRAQMLDKEIGRVIKATEASRERIGMLRGEWALLNEPERLGELSQQHLALRTLAPSQFAALADLPARLPAPVAPGTVYSTPGATTEEPGVQQAEAAPVPATPQAAAAARAIQTRPLVPPTPAPVQTAEAPRTPAPKPAARTPAPAAPVPPAPVLAAATPAPLPAAPRPILAPVISAALPLPTHPVQQAAASAATAPGSIGEAVLRATRARQGAAVPAAPSYAPSYAPVVTPIAAPAYAPAYAPTYTPAASVSALGSGRSALPPPTPYGR